MAINPTSTRLPVVAIVGRANVGKSSLFNRLIGRRQAITDDNAGTTRDAVGATVNWNRHDFRLLDTAGLEQPGSELEEQVQEQVSAAAEMADVILVAVDAATIITDQDREAAKRALRTKKPVILVLNKVDTLGRDLPEGFERLGIKEMIGVSSAHGIGTGDLLDAIVRYLPEIHADDLEQPIRFALIGRPNVGKSSLLNSLAGKQQAVVSPVAGTTRDVREIAMRAHNKDIVLVDTAGLRRRGKIEAGVEKYSASRTAAAIESSDVCALIIDATEPSVSGDQHLGGMIREAGKGMIIVINKWDLVEKDDKTQSDFLKKLTVDFAFAPWAPVVFTSAVTGLHVTELLKLVTEIAVRRQTRIPTHAFNTWLERVTAEHPPSGKGNRHPKMKYGLQIDSNPPRYALFTTHSDIIHFSYRRYLENSLRKDFDFIGTPIEIEYRAKKENEKE